jgi:septum formation protein
VDHAVAYPPDFRLIVASQSPRRHSLLTDAGVPFTVVTSAAEEALAGAPAPELAEANAWAKVTHAALPVDVRPGDFVLGTDTLVVVGDKAMGKPGSVPEAARMLRELSGVTHRVVSGVALARLDDGGTLPARENALVACGSTEVTFAVLGESEIETYLALGEWKGKAGAYAVQGTAGLWVKELRGEYSNVVGLPLHLVWRLFKQAGFDLVQRMWIDDESDSSVVTA